MGWVVKTDFIDDWLDSLDLKSITLVASAFRALELEGPTLGRPLVDQVKGSVIHNLKELRPGSSGRSELRILFAFDEQRKAIMLLAGDKSGFLRRGPKWNKWYKTAIPEAERRYTLYQKQAQRGAPHEQNS